MTPAKHPKSVPVAKFVDCPHCGGSIQVIGMRSTNMMDLILEKLLEAGAAGLTTQQIDALFPNYGYSTVKNALSSLKRDGRACNPSFKLWRHT